MPVTLPPLSRRRFVGTSLAAVCAPGIRVEAAEDRTVPLDPSRVALLADTHIDRDAKRFIYGTKWPGSPVKGDEHEGVNMADCLERVVRDVLSLNPLPAHAVVNGDCARTSGNAGEYQEFLRLIQPLRDAGITVHVTIGNHDNRRNLWAGIPDLKTVANGRHVGTVQLPGADLVLLDSDRGTMGADQLNWLQGQLADEKRRKVPVLGFIHYNPYPRPGIRPSKGLVKEESEALLRLLTEQSRAKALFFGHTHDWTIEEWIGVHMVNQPAVSYYFGKGKAHGWLDMQLGEQGAALQLRCVDPKHPQHGEQHVLKWR